MPQLDMPVAELASYTGRNPRPDDFDAYWDQTCAEVDALGTTAQFDPAAFQLPGVDCQELRFQGLGGSEVFAKYLCPQTSGPCPAVLCFHGYSASSGDWSHHLRWVQQGYAVAALDCRGQGGLSQDTVARPGTTLAGHIVRGLDSDDPRDLAFRMQFADTRQLARIVAAQAAVDAQQVFCQGGSQGGGLSLACAALAPELIAGCASLYPFLCDYQRIWEMDLAKDAYNELRNWFRSHDPRHLREEAIFTRLGYIDCQHLAPRIRAPLLMGTGLMDSICPPSSQYAAFNKVPGQKKHLLWPDFGHEGLPGWDDTVQLFFQGLRTP